MYDNTADKLNYLNETKIAIKNAIVNKGQTVNSGDSFRSFASKIENIQTGVNLEDYWDLNPGAGKWTVYDYILQIPNLSTSKITTLNYGFAYWGYGSQYGGIPNIPNWDVSNVTKMDGIFENSKVLLNNLPSDWNTSKVLYMNNSFRSCKFLEGFPANWNTSAVFTFDHIFDNCMNLNSYKLPNFNTSNAQYARGMFANCSNVNFINTPNFNFSKLERGEEMFFRCQNLKTIPNFNFSNLIYMNDMFNGCYNLASFPNFNAPKVAYAINTFAYCYNINLPSSLNFPNLYMATYMFYHINLTNISNFNLTTNNTTGLNCDWMFAWCQKLATISNFSFSNWKTAINMFNACQNLITVSNLICDSSRTGSKCTHMFGYLYNLTTISNSKFSNIDNAYMLCYWSNHLTTLSDIEFSNINNFAYAFDQCSNINTLLNIKFFNINNRYSWLDKSSLTNVSNIKFKNINVESFFQANKNLILATQLDLTNSIQTIKQIFDGCINLIEVSFLNVSEITENGLVYSFRNCNNLSNNSIQNIVNMCLNSNITNTSFKNLRNTNYYSPFYETNIANTRYQNRWTELTAAGWTY